MFRMIVILMFPMFLRILDQQDFSVKSRSRREPRQSDFAEASCKFRTARLQAWTISIIRLDAFDKIWIIPVAVH